MLILDALEEYARSGQVPLPTAEMAGNNVAPNLSSPILGRSNQYDFEYRVFPSDLGTDANKHYVVFNINVQIDSEDKGAKTTGSAYNTADFTNINLTGDLSKVDQLRFGNDGNASFIWSALTGGANVDLPRYTKRIAESIAMHMPTPLTFTSTNVYEDVSLTSFAGQVGKIAGSAVGKAMAAGPTRRATDAFGNVISSGGSLLGTALQIGGNPINPRIEVLFANTLQRQFAFEFLMAPRTEEESYVMDRIIRTFKFHSAPAINSASIKKDENGEIIPSPFEIGKYFVPFYIPPAEFDITFFNNGVENDRIPRINTCVLERIEVDYAPTGMYATFSNGYPVACRLSMSFRETEVVHKQRVAQGF
jgi:hypothetical protein